MPQIATEPMNGYWNCWIDSQDCPGVVFEQLDRSRRWLGELLDLLGCCTQETPSRVAFQEPGVTLRSYSSLQAVGPVLLVVPAPIKRPYIWDLLPSVSVVQRCLHGGLRVYLTQWERPGEAEQGFGLAEYADRLILDCLRAIAVESREPQVFLAGHSLGAPWRPSSPPCTRAECAGSSSWEPPYISVAARACWGPWSRRRPGHTR